MRHLLVVAAVLSVSCVGNAQPDQSCAEPQALASEARFAIHQSGDPETDSFHLERWAIVVEQHPDCFTVEERVDVEQMNREVNG